MQPWPSLEVAEIPEFSAWPVSVPVWPVCVAVCPVWPVCPASAIYHCTMSSPCWLAGGIDAIDEQISPSLNWPCLLPLLLCLLLVLPLCPSPLPVFLKFFLIFPLLEQILSIASFPAPLPPPLFSPFCIPSLKNLHILHFLHFYLTPDPSLLHLHFTIMMIVIKSMMMINVINVSSSDPVDNPRGLGPALFVFHPHSD